ncbi:MAG TPA: outer membrane protein assembly factor BamB [Thiohalobacter sp.]|nr:outer membrane protein assembly factor BamB [Thiohalobacter sp.]
MRVLLPLLLLALALPGCAWLRGDDNTEPPTELHDFEAEVELERLWSRDIGAGTDDRFLRLQPVVDGGRIFAVDHQGRVMALEAATGKLVWERDTGLAVSGGVGAGDGLILIGSSEGEVLALDWRDGAEVWRARVSGEVLAPPQAARGVAVVQSVDGDVTGLDSATGERRWVFDRTVPALSLRGTASPTLVEGFALIGQDSGKLAAVELERGLPVWEAAISRPTGRSELERMVDIDSPPRIQGNAVYTVTYQGHVAAVEGSSGNKLWDREMSSAVGLDVDFRYVYVTDQDSRVWALDRRNGSAVWQNERLLHRQLTAPAALDDHVLVADLEGYLHALSRFDGAIVGRTRVSGDPILSAPVVDGDTVYIYASDGTLAAYKVNTR